MENNQKPIATQPLKAGSGRRIRAQLEALNLCLEQMFLDAKDLHPRWGDAAIRAQLARDPAYQLVSQVINRLLKQRNQILKASIQAQRQHALN